jgi:gamma-glutamylcyclotransferase (GGCT)/AIG2-like uncharacterized protein YtfP
MSGELAMLIENGMKHLVAVYGTLKTDYYNYAHYMYNKSEYKGATWIQGFLMKHLGGHPSIVRKDGYKVWVEVHEIGDDVLAALDLMEGVKHQFFLREQIQIPIFGTERPINIYTQSHKPIIKGERFVPSGLWEGAKTISSQWLGDESEQRLLGMMMEREEAILDPDAGDRDQEIPFEVKEQPPTEVQSMRIRVRPKGKLRL